MQGPAASLRAVGGTAAFLRRSRGPDGPVRLVSVRSDGHGGGTVAFPDKPVIDCRLAGAVGNWVGSTVAPLAGFLPFVNFSLVRPPAVSCSCSPLRQRS